MLITKIQKDDKRIYSVFVDDEYCFKVDKQDIHKLSIYEGREINNEELAWLKYQASFCRAKSTAIYYVSFRARTEYEVRKKLIESEVNNDIIDEVIEFLTENGYIDDKIYAKKYYSDKMRLSNSSNMSAANKLREKGIPRDIIESIIYDENNSEIEAAERLVKKKFKNIEDMDKLEIKQFLYKKGFSMKTISEIIDAIGEENI